jgi:hypothetical protein
MNTGRTVFSQVIELLPHQEFQKCVARYGGYRYLKNFSCWDQYLAMAFAQLTYRESLSDIEACLRSISGKLMDRGYIDFERLFVFTLCSAFFVVRTKENVLLQRRYSHPVDKTTGVRSDHTVILTAINSAKAYPDPLRRVSYFDIETKKRLKFLTNNFTLPALTITQIYKWRWQVELFFDSSTWCTPSDAMEFQELIALNRPLMGALGDSVPACIARRLLCAESMVR